jgi:hypothetical protein
LPLLQQEQLARSTSGSTFLGRWMASSSSNSSSSSGRQQAQLSTAALLLLGPARWFWLLPRAMMLLLRGLWRCTS